MTTKLDLIAPVHGKKHIARLERRANALEARFMASPDQADFDDERAELKSLRWAIDQLRDAAPSDPSAEAVAYLCNATRFKLSFSERGNVSVLAAYKSELNGKWVALVDATDNKHMAAAPTSQREPGMDAVIEQCAKLLDERADGWGNLQPQMHSSIARRQEDRQMAAAIRALATPPSAIEGKK